MSLSNKIACVTGATGMIGRRIVPHLLQLGYQVRILTRQHAHKLPSHGLTVYQGDICDGDRVNQFVEGASMVFHCAAELKNPDLMWDVNVLGTENIVKAAQHAGVHYFCLMSSAGVIGKTSERFITESTSAVPQNAYEQSKFEAEQCLYRLGIKGASVVILRPTNVVDEYRLGDLALVKQGGLVGQMKIWLKGAECAHLVHAEDVARAAIYFLSAPCDSPEVFFVSCDHEQWNTVAGLRAVYQRLQFGDSLDGLKLPFHAPIEFPYWLRRLFRGYGNRGDVIYSSDKLMHQGFSFHFGIEKMVRCVLEKNCQSIYLGEHPQ